MPHNRNFQLFSFIRFRILSFVQNEQNLNIRILQVAKKGYGEIKATHISLRQYTNRTIGGLLRRDEFYMRRIILLRKTEFS